MKFTKMDKIWEIDKKTHIAPVTRLLHVKVSRHVSACFSTRKVDNKHGCCEIRDTIKKPRWELDKRTGQRTQFPNTK